MPSAVVDFAQGANATMVVVGVSRHSRWREALLGSTSTEIARLAGAIDVHLVTHERARSGARPLASSALSPSRRLAGWVLAFVAPLALTGLLVLVQEDVSASTELMLFLAAAVGVALVGGRWPAVACAAASFLCLNWFFTEPTGRFTIADPENLLALVVFVLVAAAVASVVDLAARRASQAYRARAEASTLAALSRSVLSGEDTADAVVSRLAETFQLAHVALEERVAERAPWTTIAEAARSTASPGGGGSGSGSDSDDDRTIVRIDDTRRLVLTGRPLPAGDRQVLEAFGTQAGIVLEHRRLSARAEKARILEEADATRTALLAAVSHDLRTPLASIRAAVDGLRSDAVALDPDDEAALVDTAATSTARLEQLIDNLLDASRLESGALSPVLRDVSLDEIVPLAVDPFADHVSLEVPDDLPLVHTDPGLLERVVANIVANAVRHAPGGVPVRVLAARAGDSVELRVEDRGPGLDDARKARMFEPFQRLGDVSGTGLGLGLAVAAGLSRAVGATIAPEDTPGGGLTMVLTVPMAGG